MRCRRSSRLLHGQPPNIHDSFTARVSTARGSRCGLGGGPTTPLKPTVTGRYVVADVFVSRSAIGAAFSRPVGVGAELRRPVRSTTTWNHKHRTSCDVANLYANCLNLGGTSPGGSRTTRSTGSPTCTSLGERRAAAITTTPTPTTSTKASWPGGTCGRISLGHPHWHGVSLVGARGFEPPTPCSQGRCASQAALHPGLSTMLPAACAGTDQVVAISSTRPQLRAVSASITRPVNASLAVR